MKNKNTLIGAIMLTLCLVVVATGCISLPDDNAGNGGDEAIGFTLDFEEGLDARFGDCVIEPERTDNVMHDATTSTLMLGQDPRLSYPVYDVFPNASGHLTMKFQGPDELPGGTTMLFAVYTDDDNRMYLRIEIAGENAYWHLYYRAQGITSNIKTPIGSSLSNWQTVEVKWDAVNGVLKLAVDDDVFLEYPKSLPAISVTDSTKLTIGSYGLSFSWPYHNCMIDYLCICPE